MPVVSLIERTTADTAFRVSKPPSRIVEPHIYGSSIERLSAQHTSVEPSFVRFNISYFNYFFLLSLIVRFNFDIFFSRAYVFGFVLVND